MQKNNHLFLMFIVAILIIILCGAGLGDERSRSAPASVSRDSLESLVRYLTTDPATADLRSRFALREEAVSLIADSLAARLERYLSATAMRMPFPFEAPAYIPDSTFTNDNVIVLLEGTGAVEGAFIISAHYDAIASSDEGWLDTWQTHPAPGANDNASGVAAICEIARSLAGEALPFDCLFVLFSAEELTVIGSTYFVEHYNAWYDGEIIGVLNLDMIGHREPGAEAGMQLISNYQSGWLADMIIASAERSDPALVTTIMKPGVPYYDHAPFWSESITAISFTEPFEDNTRILYPYYHSMQDTAGWVDFEQVERITAVASHFLIETSNAPAELAMGGSDLNFCLGTGITSRREFSLGDTIVVQARPRNIGPVEAPRAALFRLEISIETRSGSDLIYSALHSPAPPFDCVTVDLPLVLDERYSGGIMIHAKIEVEGMEDDPSNNETSEPVSVAGGDEVLLEHYFQPHPIRGSFGSAMFCADLSAETDMKVEIFTLEGELIGRAFLGYGSGFPLAAGLNCFECSSIFTGIGRLASGMYPYRIVLFDESGPVKSETGLFAVEN